MALLFAFLLTACSSGEKTNSTPPDGPPETRENNAGITIESPMTLSNNDLFSVSGEHQYLRLKMIRGRYHEDWSPGAYMGTLWEGDYVIELNDESGSVLASTDLSKVYQEPLIFNCAFQLQFDDYNNDGDPDFTIGQYASGNGNAYRIFTLRKDGKIEALPVHGQSELFMGNMEERYSAKLEKVNDTAFKAEYYDNSKGETVERVFAWNGKAFVQTDSPAGNS
jgi:bla regulator protein BlaR1